MIYIAHVLLYRYTQGGQVWIIQFYLHITPYVALPRKHSPDGAGGGHLIAAYYPFVDPEMVNG